MNDVAYGYGGDFVRALGELPKEAANLYAALVDGRPAAGLLAVDNEGDCWITFVATLPEARGRGLATALMTQALLDARKRGCTTTSLQATKMGRPVYERLGYRDLGADPDVGAPQIGTTRDSVAAVGGAGGSPDFRLPAEPAQIPAVKKKARQAE